MRPEEERAAERLKAFLEEHGHIASYEPGADPPDMVFHVDGDVWLVEHTQLHEYGVNAEGQVLSRPNAEAAQERFVQELRKRTHGKVKGCWRFCISVSLDKETTERLLSSAEKAILGDNPGTFHFPSTTAWVIRHDGSQDVGLYPGFSGGEIQARVDYAVRKALLNKAKMCAKLPPDNRLVLLLESCYFLASIGNVSEAIRHYPAQESRFDHIFLITFHWINDFELRNEIVVRHVGGAAPHDGFV